MPKTTWQALTTQIISRENKIQAKKSPRKAERNPKGWTGIREEMLNEDNEKGHAKSCPPLALQGRERKHSHTSQGYEENWVLWGIPGQDQKGKGTCRERQR